MMQFVNNDTNGNADKAAVDLFSMILNAVRTELACIPMKKMGPATFNVPTNSFDSTSNIVTIEFQL